MANDRYSLQPELLRRGRRLTIYHMVVNGRDEFQDFIGDLDIRNNESDHNFLAHFVELLTEVGEKGVSTRSELFRRLHPWTDIWEIRRRRGRVNYRFYGFMVADREFYMVRCVDKRGEKADPQDLRFVDRVRKDWLAQTEKTRHHEDGDKQ